MSVGRKTLTACVIDDDDIFIYGFKKFMEIRGIDADIIDFRDGLQALDYLTDPFNIHKMPDIIFVDINMPVMDGWEFTRNYGELEHRLGKKVPVYAISSSVDVNDIRRAKKDPVIKDYILKPLDELFVSDIINSLRPDAGSLTMNA